MADLVREASLVAGKQAALLADLQGAKVRVGRLEREVPIAEGQPVILVGLEVDVREHLHTLPPDAAIIPVDFDLAPHIKPGGTVLIDDGNLEVLVEAVIEGHVHCRTVHGGAVKSRKGVNVPYTLLPIPALTDKDRADAAFAVGSGGGLDRAQLCRHGGGRDRTARDRGEGGGTCPRAPSAAHHGQDRAAGRRREPACHHPGLATA